MIFEIFLKLLFWKLFFFQIWKLYKQVKLNSIDQKLLLIFFKHTSEGFFLLLKFVGIFSYLFTFTLDNVAGIPITIYSNQSIQNICKTLLKIVFASFKSKKK